LLTERSITRWAQQLAAEHNYPVDEVLSALAEAVLQNELPVYHRSICGVDDEPINVYRRAPIIDSLTSVLYWPYLGLGRANHHLKDLDNLMITAADMACWLRSRGVVWSDEPKSQSTGDEEKKKRQFLAWREADKDKHGSYPPLQSKSKGRVTVREWAVENGVKREIAEWWAKEAGPVRRGRPVSVKLK
jgi:hypothetical protein